MSSQGPNSPSTVTTNALGEGERVFPWDDPVSDASTEDDLYTQSSAFLDSGGEGNQKTEWLICTNFGFTIPNGATITGFLVEVDSYAETSPIGTSFTAKLYYNGSLYGNYQFLSPDFDDDPSEQYRSVGGDGELLDFTDTFAEVNSSDFGVAVEMSADSGGDPNGPYTAFVDHVRLTVFYTGGSEATQYTASQTLFIHGHQSINSGKTLVMTGHNPGSSGETLYTFGHGQTPSGMPLYIPGHTGISNTMPLYMAGHLSYPSGQTLFTRGVGSSQYCSLFVNGVFSHNSGIPLYTFGNNPSSNGLHLFIGDFGNRIENSMTLFLKNPGADSGMELVIWGDDFSLNPDQTLNGIPKEGSLYLYIQGQGASDGLPLYMNSTAFYNNNISLYTNSINNINNNIPIYIKAYDAAIEMLRLYTHGF